MKTRLHCQHGQSDIQKGGLREQGIGIVAQNERDGGLKLAQSKAKNTYQLA
jgi:hypothetical protein